MLGRARKKESNRVRPADWCKLGTCLDSFQEAKLDFQVMGTDYLKHTWNSEVNRQGNCSWPITSEAWTSVKQFWKEWTEGGHTYSWESLLPEKSGKMKHSMCQRAEESKARKQWSLQIILPRPGYLPISTLSAALLSPGSVPQPHPQTIQRGTSGCTQFSCTRQGGGKKRTGDKENKYQLC